MANLKRLFKYNFLEYASYVIKDRAIPHIDDGLKPVQRRILHSLFEMDDGKFQKVANVVGHCMKYHPHGDISIFSALVGLANKDLFIEKQGNFGNIFTGDEASAARYIECRLFPLAKEVLFNPDITELVESYDGRNHEPISFPAKIPVLLIHGAEGIAVGMSTKILPHNFVEVLKAVIASLKGEQFQLFPDFPTGGFIDVSEYNDGNGKILVRAKLDTKDDKKIVIRELPFGSTTESLINSIEAAAKKNRIKISGINDYSADNVELEIRLARGVHTKETIDALLAFTDCESSIPVNFTLIKDKQPVTMTVTQVVQYHANKLIEILHSELSLQKKDLMLRFHRRTLEQIFVEERIYKKIEKMKSRNGVFEAVINGFQLYKQQIQHDITTDDVEHLLKIPIQRISLYDINKLKKEMRDIQYRIKEIKGQLSNITDYAISVLENLIERYGHMHPRHTRIISFDQVDVREAAQRNLKLRYDRSTGYLGYETGGNLLFEVSQYDKILIIRKTGAYSVINVPNKIFVDKGIHYCGLVNADNDLKTIFTVIYRNDTNRCPYLKRCRIDKYILNKGYSLVPDKCTVLKITAAEDALAIVDYKPKPRVRILREHFKVSDYAVQGVKAKGVRLANREVKSAKFVRRIEE